MRKLGLSSPKCLGYNPNLHSRNGQREPKARIKKKYLIACVRRVWSDGEHTTSIKVNKQQWIFILQIYQESVTATQICQPEICRSHLKNRILVQGQGGADVHPAGILKYSEELKRGPNTEIGPKDFFEIACSKDHTNQTGFNSWDPSSKAYSASLFYYLSWLISSFCSPSYAKKVKFKLIIHRPLLTRYHNVVFSSIPLDIDTSWFEHSKISFL